MVLWCLKDNQPPIKFYEKRGGRIEKERAIQISEQNYLEVCLTYNIPYKSISTPELRTLSIPSTPSAFL